MSRRNRPLRVGDEMRRQLSELISRELKDPRIPMMTTVTQIDVSGDLGVATCYISVLGSEEEAREALVALENASGFLRRELGARMRLRTSPELRFRHDHSIEHGFEVMRRIDEAMGRSAAGPAHPADDGAAD
ncbi:MAG: 30S ribosome-binding factor RbfA [Bacillota bacterium]|nr:30S ribosome-binding factor RbfA [Bacillota bacterium]